MSGPTVTQLPCPALWDGPCSSWGAVGPHACNRTRQHDGDCTCLCGRDRAGAVFTPQPTVDA